MSKQQHPVGDMTQEMADAMVADLDWVETVQRQAFGDAGFYYYLLDGGVFVIGHSGQCSFTTG